MFKMMMVSMMIVSMVGCAGPYPADAQYAGRRCTSNVQCQRDEVCWTTDITAVSPYPERGAVVIRDGYCGKLSSD
jgi:hypothetical protein